MKADRVVKHRTFLNQGQKAKVNINFICEDSGLSQVFKGSKFACVTTFGALTVGNPAPEESLSMEQVLI